MLDAVVSRSVSGRVRLARLVWPKRFVSHTKYLPILGGLVCLARIICPKRVSKTDKACLVPRDIHLSNKACLARKSQ